MLSRQRESAREILLLPLKTARRTPGIGKIASRVAVGKNRERLSPLPKHVELESLVGEQRRKKRLVLENRLLGRRNEFAVLLRVRRSFLRTKSIQSNVTLLFRKERADKFQPIPAVQC